MSGGILTRISICKSNSWKRDREFDLKKEINGILDDMGNFVDISKYEILECDDGYNLNLKVDCVNENIYDLLVEMNKVNKRINFVDMDYDVSSIDDEYIKEHPMTCSIGESHYVLKYNDCEENDHQLYFPLYWILSSKKYFDNVYVYGAIIPIWYDCNKISFEDETFILMLMNTMKTKYFKSELSKCLVFEVLG